MRWRNWLDSSTVISCAVSLGEGNPAAMKQGKQLKNFHLYTYGAQIITVMYMKHLCLIIFYSIVTWVPSISKVLKYFWNMPNYTSDGLFEVRSGWKCSKRRIFTCRSYRQPWTSIEEWVWSCEEKQFHSQ